MITVPMFMQGEPVFYVGEKFREKLHGKKGWIHAPVVGSTSTFIVEFPDTRNGKDMNDSDDYVMPARVLSKWRPSPAEVKKQEGPEVAPRRRRNDPEEQ
jgi:hypothetical protein